MHLVGIICEYNPFHNGHLYHLKKIKELYPNSLIILVLNSLFTQRGEISILSLSTKSKIALEYGVDIVLELPIIFGTQSADTFALKSIEILNYFQVDTIIFGSETNDLTTLENIAIKQLAPNYNQEVKKYLKEKNNYPTALAKALDSDFDFNNPNDLLGISYIKAIKQLNLNMKYECIKRTSSYHDLKSTNKIVSASNIRNKFKNQKNINKYLPSKVKDELKNINEDLLFTLLKYKINTCDNLEIYLDVDEGIENRIKKVINSSKNMEDLIMKIKSKRYTYNKIRRMLIHILLDFKKSDNLNKIEYIKILGFNQKGQDYLNKIKKEINISLNQIPSSNTFKLEQKATIIYDLLTNSNEQKFLIANKPIIK